MDQAGAAIAWASPLLCWSGVPHPPSMPCAAPRGIAPMSVTSVSPVHRGRAYPRCRRAAAGPASSTWHVQIDGKRDGLSDARRYPRLCRHGDAGDVGPGGERLGAAETKVRGGVVVSAAGENVRDLVMGGKEAGARGRP